MKLRLVGLLALIGAAAFCARADEYPFKEPFEKSGAFNAAGTLVVANVNGAVDVRAWDKNEIRISGEKAAATAEDLKAIELTIEQTADRAVVKVKLPKHGGRDIRATVQIHVMLPASAKLDNISSVNGAIDIVGVRGGVRASSANGHVKASDVTGNTNLSAVNGRIDARITALPSGSHVALDTTNGTISLTLPADVSAAVEGSTVNGSISCDFPIEVSGGIVGHSLHGTLGTGASTIKANTVNGSLKLKKL